MKRLVLIDGHALLHRAYHAFPLNLKTRKGELVNAVYGFTRILLTVLEDLKPDYLAVAFDLPKPTFRHQEYVGYQVQRPEMDKKLESQIKRVYEILGALNIPIFTQEGYEADDVIGTLARQAVENGERKKKESKKLGVIIVTGDRDMMQLIDKNVKVYAPKKGFSEPELFDEKKVKLFLGLTPQQIIDYKALIGDASDNYPGVLGVGPKTAVNLLSRFKSLKQIYQSLDKIESPLKEKLQKGKEAAFLSQKLATIVKNVPIKIDLKACRVHDYNRQKAIKLFEELEFKSLIDKLPEGKELRVKKDRQEKKNEQTKLF